MSFEPASAGLLPLERGGPTFAKRSRGGDHLDRWVWFKVIPTRRQHRLRLAGSDLPFSRGGGRAQRLFGTLNSPPSRLRRTSPVRCATGEELREGGADDQLA